MTETDDEICSACNGSGEGHYDGSICTSCGGSGAEPVSSDDDPDGDAMDRAWEGRHD